MSLEAAEAVARANFACRFSNADEYETALIVQRRAQGRYGTTRGRIQYVLVSLCALALTGLVLLFR